MRSRKILVAVVIGLLLVGAIGPAVAVGDTEAVDYSACTTSDWIQWFLQYLIWIANGRPNGPPVPQCG